MKRQKLESMSWELDSNEYEVNVCNGVVWLSQNDDDWTMSIPLELWVEMNRYVEERTLPIAEEINE